MSNDWASSRAVSSPVCDKGCIARFPFAAYGMLFHGISLQKWVFLWLGGKVGEVRFVNYLDRFNLFLQAGS